MTYCFPPHGAIGTQRTLRLVRCLSEHGWDVSVITPKPSDYLPGTPVDDALMSRVPAPVRVERTSVWRPIEALTTSRPNPGASSVAPMAVSESAGGRRRSLRSRVRQMLARATSIPDQDLGWGVPATVAALRSAVRPDVVYSSGPPYTGHLAGLVASRVLRRPWVADFRDPWARAPWRTENQSRGVRAAHAWLESRVVHAASAVLFTTDAAREEFAAHYGPSLAKKFTTIRNGCDPSPTSSDHVPASERFTLLHAGSLYGGRDPRPLLSAIAAVVSDGRVARGGLELSLLGGVELDGVNLRAEVDRLGISDVVRFTPRASHQVSLAAMRSASALLLLQPGTTLSIPGKLYEYFAAGRPILALTEEGETAELIRGAGAGIVVQPDDQAAIERALIHLLQRSFEFTPAPSAVYDGAARAGEIMQVLWRVQSPGSASSADAPAAAVTGEGRR